MPVISSASLYMLNSGWLFRRSGSNSTDGFSTLSSVCTTPFSTFVSAMIIFALLLTIEYTLSCSSTFQLMVMKRSLMFGSGNAPSLRSIVMNDDSIRWFFAISLAMESLRSSSSGECIPVSLKSFFVISPASSALTFSQ